MTRELKQEFTLRICQLLPLVGSDLRIHGPDTGDIQNDSDRAGDFTGVRVHGGAGEREAVPGITVAAVNLHLNPQRLLCFIQIQQHHLIQDRDQLRLICLRDILFPYHGCGYGGGDDQLYDRAGDFTGVRVHGGAGERETVPSCFALRPENYISAVSQSLL